MPLMGIDGPAVAMKTGDLKTGVRCDAWGKGKREKKKEHCDQDGLLRSRTAGGHDDCTNVSFFVGIPNSQRCCISICVLSSIAGELLQMFEIQCKSPQPFPRGPAALGTLSGGLAWPRNILQPASQGELPLPL